MSWHGLFSNSPKSDIQKEAEKLHMWEAGTEDVWGFVLDKLEITQVC